MTKSDGMRVVDTDVLVIGGGAAGARAALAAHEAGAKVNLAVKGWFGPPGYRGAGATGSGGDPQWGWSTGRGVPGRPDEEEELNVKLVLQAGLGMADPRLVRSMVAGTMDATRELEEWGLVI
ncbi:MAG: FAD-binding protein, partial [Sulfuricaulis sp.]|nr:FAD-binding protein [Sulfuricaulis sp.]